MMDLKYNFSIMEGEESLSRYSPEIVAKTSSAETIALLPLVVLMHGTEDYSIPSSSRFVHIPSIDVCLENWRENQVNLEFWLTWFLYACHAVVLKGNPMAVQSH